MLDADAVLAAGANMAGFHDAACGARDDEPIARRKLLAELDRLHAGGIGKGQARGANTVTLRRLR